MKTPEREANGTQEANGEAEDAAEHRKAEPLRIAAAPPRVMRLSRKALASLGAIAGVGISGALFYALQSPDRTPPENLYDAESRTRPEQVTGAPASYADSVKTGPSSFSGGNPSLAANQHEGSMQTSGSPGGASLPDARQTAAEQARDRAERERDSARTSRLFLAGETAGNSGPVAPAPSLTAAPAAVDDGAAAPPPPTIKQQALLEARNGRAAESAARIREPTSRYILQAGSVIPAALITGIRSDLPGQITAQVTQNVYDSPTGRLLLIPQGSRLIGEYDSEVSAGQNRILLAWDRLILPGGRSIALDRLPGADAAGMSGLQDGTEYHWGHMFKAALVSTLLGIGSELVADDDGDLVRALRYGAQDTVSQTGRQLVERQLSIPPTLTIRSGFALRVIVTRDLVFESQGGME